MKMRLALLPLALLGLSLGCGSQGPIGPAGPAGDAGPAGPPGNNGAVIITVPSNSSTPTDATSAAWAALDPKVTVNSVTIASPPVVKFTVTTAGGTPIVGLGNTSKSSTATVPGLTNLAFSLAKLVPAANGSPSKWVSYIVTTVPTTTTPAIPTRPTTDNTGTLVDNGDGSYVYTFYRDVPATKATVAGMDAGTNNPADLGDLTYDPTLVHRLTIQLAGNAPGTGSNTPNAVTVVPGVPLQNAVDTIYDFKPGSGPVTASGRDMVTTENCDTCHQVLGGIPGGDPEANGAGFHGGSRNEVRYCVVCHTEQRKYGQKEAAYDATTLTFKSADGGTDLNTTSTYRFRDRALGNLPNQIHHIHAGPLLAFKNYNYAGVTFNEVLHPQDLRNCDKCHNSANTSTPDAKNWKQVPNRLACGGCHDGIDFATGKGVTIADAAKGQTSSNIGGTGLAHIAGPMPDDSTCATCHGPSGSVDVDVVHRPVTPPAAGNALLPGGTNANTNAAWIASNPARLPAGAIAVSYDIKSVSLDANRHPVMVFRFLQNGTPVPLNVFASANVNPASGAKEIWDNFMGSPSLYFVFSVPQDGVGTPSDFNVSASGYLRAIWNGTATGTGAGTLSTPDANGYYTGTLTGITVPTGAAMLTGGIGYTYNVTSTLPLTQTAKADGTRFDLYPVWNFNTTDKTVPCVTAANAASPKCNGGLIVIAPNAQKVATGFTGRRAIVEDKRCNACHQELGTFTEDAFHAGQRNDGTTCAWCHRPNQTSSGWSADSVYFVHAIHAGNKRSTEFTWHASDPTTSFAEVKYPGVLNFCEGCHIPGAVDFGNTDSQAQVDNRLYRTVATGAFNGNFGNPLGATIPTYSYSKTTDTCVAGTSTADATSTHSLSPYVTSAAPGTTTPNYGAGFSFNAASVGITGGNCQSNDGTSCSCSPTGAVIKVAPQQTFPADTITLVNSPVAGVCFACHDTPSAMAHFELNGGSIYNPRSTALNATETCLVCHGQGRIADIAQVHAQ